MNALQHARYLEGLAIQVEVIAMQEENKQRERDGKSPAYDARAFFEAAARMENFAMCILREQ